ncbi:g8512 [Coccomyxa elongata]
MRSDQALIERTPTISFNALRRSRTTIEDFVQTYFPYHNMQIPQDFFKYLDLVLFVEATIYQADETNELYAKQGLLLSQAHSETMKTLQAVLEDRGLWSRRFADELSKGEEYWRLERAICAAMLRHPRCSADSTPESARHLSIDQIHKASLAKSFDYRVLNLLLYGLTGRPVDEQLMAFLAVDEHLVDIGDDLVDYEDDVMANSFNIYRGYVHLHGSHAQLAMIDRIAELEAQHAALLAQLPHETRQKFRRRHAEASEAPGSGNWTFPQPILDEASYRQQFADSASQ